MAAANFKTKTARDRLTPRHMPYWDNLQRGLSIGYRKNAGEFGTWIGRRASGGQPKYQYQTVGDERGMDYPAAKKAVEKWNDELASGVVVHTRQKHTVADACRAYVANRRARKGADTAYDAERRFTRYVYPETCGLKEGESLPDGSKKRKRLKREAAFVYENPIGEIPLAQLRPHDVERWCDAQLDSCDFDPEDDEELLRAKDTINRNLKSLKAALNYAKNKLNWVATDKGWKEAEMYKREGGKDVGARRIGYLDAKARAELLGVLPADLRNLAQAMLHIGARPGELAKANVSNLDKVKGELTLTKGKTGERTVTLSTKALEFFKEQTKGRIGNAPLLPMENGERWSAPIWGRLFREARVLAKMPDAVLYYFRHTFIREYIDQGIDIYTVALQCGTSVEIIETNYGGATENLRARLDKVSIL
ncbi:tyrosine-type recombinase/integrase [Paraburkholderia oxyphila]|uniref:tyrosine-type recombinase/integrase n=1 Tax=Paraburkholderia oxyphila TaxID=614212 RepID=UPI0004837CEB|nr:tyrosine-type recombinase/integrase [Paraburkholderia oxyphila]